MIDEEFEKFRHTAQHELTDLNNRCKQEFSIGHWEGCEYDSKKGTIVFSEGGAPKVIAMVQVVGTTSARSKSWLWGWANESVPRDRTVLLEKVRAFGKTEGLDILTEASWPDDEYHGWEMTAITAKLVCAKGGYRMRRADGGYSYYVFTDIRLAGQSGPKPN